AEPQAGVPARGQVADQLRAEDGQGAGVPDPRPAVGASPARQAVDLVVTDRAVLNGQGSRVVDRPEEGLRVGAGRVIADAVAADRGVVQGQRPLVDEGGKGGPGETQAPKGGGDAATDE